MKLFTLAALFAASCLQLPAFAKVDPHTDALIEATRQHGVLFEMNTRECNGSFHGLYNSTTKHILICFEGWPSATAHDTVRHEAFHAAQNCANKKRGGFGLRPILQGAELKRFVESTLNDGEIVAIKSFYPKEQWLVELEAHAAAKHFTAETLVYILKTHCSKDAKNSA